LVATVLVSVAVLASAAQPDASAPIRKAVDEYIGALRPGDTVPFERLETLLAEDFFTLCSDGTTLRGRQATIDVYRQAIAPLEQFEDVEMRFDVESLRLYQEVAVVFGKYTFRAKAKGDGRAFSRDVWDTIVLRQIRGNWVLVHEHSSIVVPRAPSGDQ